jgi:aminoglycoside phosphotransferase family enzyme/predicted kinase
LPPPVAGDVEPGLADPLVAALLDPAAYDHPVERVELIETHISWIFLTGAFAYKVKKPVNLGFLNFSTTELRRQCCQDEVRLNRRLASDLYLGVRPIHGPRERAHFGAGGPVVETAVQMRQFQQRDLLPAVLARGALTPEAIEALGTDLARFHALAARSTAAAAWGTFEAVLEPALANLHTLAQLGRSPADGPELERRTRQGLEPLRPLLEARRAAGRIRECHGDLHLGNMALYGGHILVFDCLEFSPALRWIDPISDLAFLVMDLRQRRQTTLALRLLNRWLDGTGDHGGLPLLPWYLAYRALVRAKVTALRLAQGQGGSSGEERRRWEEELEHYLEQARTALAPGPGALLITHGIAGSGKSHTAAQLAERGWIHLRSDGERRRLFGRWGVGAPAGGEAPADGESLAAAYAPAVTSRLYDEVLPQAAAAALAAGLAVVVDATFLERRQRQAFQALAARCGAGFGILACTAPWQEIEGRIERRARLGSDPSEADATVAWGQLQRIEPLSEQEQTWVVRSDDPRLAPPAAALPKP